MRTPSPMQNTPSQLQIRFPIVARPGVSLALATFILLFLLSSYLRASETLEVTLPKLEIFPQKIILDGPSSKQRLITTELNSQQLNQGLDRTQETHFESLHPEILKVSESGWITPLADGKATVVARAGNLVARREILVKNQGIKKPPTLEEDVLPVLTRTGCNSGPCHGKARGQNGFQLSLLGFDPDFDFKSLAIEGRGRRISPPTPHQSLLLLKPLGLSTHGGGVRLKEGSRFYKTLVDWIQSGFPRQSPKSARLTHIKVTPTERILVFKEKQQLLVTAHFSDGSRKDVTDLAAFQSSESPITQVNEHGRLQAGNIPGEAAIMARYRGQIAVCRTSIPLPGEVKNSFYEQLPNYNFIDQHIWNKLKRLKLTPSKAAPLNTLHRRLYIDIIGRQPSPEETRAFLSNPSATKIETLIDDLLSRPEYGDFWANKWVDLLRPNPYRVGIKAVFNLDGWIRDAFRRNLPYDQFATEILTAQGSTFRQTPATIFRDRRSPDELVTMMSQLFLGIRLECAKCHHHPFEKWSQEDYYSLAAYFSKVGRKGTGLSPPISGGEEIIYVSSKGSVSHPLTGKVLDPRPLYGKATPTEEGKDPRKTLAEWMIQAQPNFFAKVQVNRVWADLFGRGIVEPIDDLRTTNPASNEELLDALAQHFQDVNYDQKKLIKTIVSSYAYGLESYPSKRNVTDTRNYSRYYRQRLRAEVLHDAIVDITQVGTRFSAHPEFTPSMRLWTHRSPSLFLDTFGRPDPNQDPPCERLPESSVVQALHLMNAPDLHNKITSSQGRSAQLAQSKMTDKEVVEELYLLSYCRYPDNIELEACLKLFVEPTISKSKEPSSKKSAQKKDSSSTPTQRNTRSSTEVRRKAIEDILWTLLNTPEFVFKT